MSLYAWILCGSFIIPFLFSFDKRIAYYKQWPALFAGIFVNAVFFLVWDGWFARNGIWGFNPDYVWNIRLNDLPLEEWLFFVIIPYCSIFIYVNFKVLLPREPFAASKHHLTLFFLVFIFVLALFNTSKPYTFYNCLFASVLLFVHLLFIRSTWMGYFWLAYFVHLIPFVIVNGILTGAATPEPVVWYNEEAILGIRIYTIPVEDAIYALTCLLFPITVMEYIQKKKRVRI